MHPPPKKRHPLFPSNPQPFFKNCDPVKHLLFENVVGGSTPAPRPPAERGGAHCAYSAKESICIV